MKHLEAASVAGEGLISFMRTIIDKLAIAVWMALLFGGTLHAGEIEWRVESGFAPFGWLSDSTKHDWMPKPDSTGKLPSFEAWYRDLHTRNMLSQSPYSEWAEKNNANSPWDAAEGHYKVDYARPQTTTLLARLKGIDGQCNWSIVAPDGSESISANHPCIEYAKLEKVPLKGASLVARAQGGTWVAEAKIEHRVVAAIGDSYASGEGNPDVPSVWKAATTKGNHGWLEPNGRKSLLEVEAAWWEPDCHRSFWSHQGFVAMRLAAENPHRLVTFLHYSCSGAEILDGLLTPQYRPPGMSSKCKSNDRQSGSAVRVIDDSKCYTRLSQIEALVTDLCSDENIDLNDSWRSELSSKIADDIRNFRGRKRFLKTESFEEWGLRAVRCKKPLRNPDILLVSVGGNDAGFAQLFAWALTPSKAGRLAVVDLLYKKLRGNHVVCPEFGRSEKSCPLYDSDLFAQLPTRYGWLALVLNTIMPNVSPRVLVNSYPAGCCCSPKTDHLCSLKIDQGWTPREGPSAVLSLLAVARL